MPICQQSLGGFTRIPVCAACCVAELLAAEILHARMPFQNRFPWMRRSVPPMPVGRRLRCRVLFWLIQAARELIHVQVRRHESPGQTARAQLAPAAAAVSDSTL
jgi:hypothetical protein